MFLIGMLSRPDREAWDDVFDVEMFMWLGIVPVAIYWAYRFITVSR